MRILGGRGRAEERIRAICSAYVDALDAFPGSRQCTAVHGDDGMESVVLKARCM